MYSHLLVPLDGSRFAESALTHALEFAQKFGSKITLVRAIDPPHTIAADVGDTADMIIKMRELTKKEAESYLQSQSGSLRQQGYDVETEILMGTSTPQAILMAADDQNVDLIVMCTHGRSGLGRFVFGSVAEKVVRHAKVPVLLIRAKENTND
jgi:nucleotide-binding universal stress UspA family protein